MDEDLELDCGPHGVRFHHRLVQALQGLRKIVLGVDHKHDGAAREGEKGRECPGGVNMNVEGKYN